MLICARIFILLSENKGSFVYQRKVLQACLSEGQDLHWSRNNAVIMEFCVLEETETDN